MSRPTRSVVSLLGLVYSVKSSTKKKVPFPMDIYGSGSSAPGFLSARAFSATGRGGQGSLHHVRGSQVARTQVSGHGFRVLFRA